MEPKHIEQSQFFIDYSPKNSFPFFTFSVVSPLALLYISADLFIILEERFVPSCLYSAIHIC